MITTNQPKSIGFDSARNESFNLDSSQIPSGLEYLSFLNELTIEQLPSLYEAITGSERNNKYSIKNANGIQIFFAVEETKYWMRKMLGSLRAFKIRILNSANTEVMRISRQFKVCSGCCWFAGLCNHCAHELVIESPVDKPIGYVVQKFSLWKANFDILDETREKVLNIRGPCLPMDGPLCFCDTEFKIYDKNGTNQVGSITKKYSGLIKEAFTNADNFRLTFPADLSVTTKASLLAALFLIDFMYYEVKSGDDKN